MSDRKLRIPIADFQRMQQHAKALAPEEVCGLLAGKDCLVSKCFIVENEIHSPTRFRMEPQSQLDAFLAIEKSGFELLAYFHSHPGGGGEPSATDLAEFLYPDVIMVILFLKDGVWQANAWDIQNKAYSPVLLEILES